MGMLFLNKNTNYFFVFLTVVFFLVIIYLFRLRRIFRISYKRKSFEVLCVLTEIRPRLTNFGF